MGGDIHLSIYSGYFGSRSEFLNPWPHNIILIALQYNNDFYSIDNNQIYFKIQAIMQKA